jgi:hypothetical protein
MADINLLSTTTQTSNTAEHSASLAVKILGGILILLLLFYGYTWLQMRRTQSALASVQTQMNRAQSEAINMKDRGQLITRQGQVQALDTLIKNHLYWSYLLPELARVTLRSASYSTIGADANGVLSLTVNLPSYAEADKYLQVFDLPQYSQQFSDVKVLSITKAQVGSTAQTQLKLQLKFNPEFIRNRIQ